MYTIGAYPRDHAEVASDVLEGAPAHGVVRKGDVIIQVDGEDGKRRSLREAVLFCGGRPVPIRVRRGGEEIDLVLTPQFSGSAGPYMVGIDDKTPPIVGEVDPGSPAERAGLRPGDVVLKVDDLELVRTGEADDERWQRLEVKFRGGQGRPLKLKVRRGEEILDLEVTPVEMGDLAYGMSGIRLGHARFSLRSANLLEATRLGIQGTLDWVKNVFLTIRNLANRRVDPKNLGGPVMIVETSYHFATQGLGTILFFLGIISVNLAILNLLPIPVLDGGLLVFLLIEKIKGSPVKEKYMIIANYIGLVLLLFLMLYVTYNDILRLIDR
jgi:regulator of sigma E protease